ncbi:site-specific DNA-methyltransferase [Ekhidna sp.]|jgi:adenine-specific DNA-methyltransferase|uniref:site-specific DNA-methyltransferase n=1 Tax=Ekhidna sp. TaxID=2608089 RepID=UPI0032EEB2CC
MAKKNNQKLELTWIGKGEEPRLEPRILIENPEYSYGDPEAENMLIHGDNLLALKALEQEYAGEVKCVYIDPPYNTGSAFEQYQDGLEHSTWLNLIKSRLKILWNLLHRKEGSLWISIDDNEMPYLRVLLDELCGRDKFIASNIWQKRYSRENREAIGDVHEYIIVYAKDRAVFKEKRNRLPLTEKQSKVYKNPNNDPKGRWRTIPITAQAGHGTKAQFYDIIGPTGKTFSPPDGNCWRYSKDAFEKLRNEGRIYFGKNGTNQPTTIRYLSEVPGIVPWTWWNHEEVGHTDESKKESIALFQDNLFDTPKPERLIERILHIATNEGDLVLDSFLGSGTTSAVAHKMGRRWIGVELGEHAKTHCLPRLKQVVKGEQGGISKSVNWKGGGGFKYYTLAPSMLNQDKYGNWVISKEYNSTMLAAAMAKQEGFRYEPHTSTYWKQGKSSEKDFIFTTTQFITIDMLDKIHDEMAEDESLLITCKAYHGSCEGRHPNITIKKIPHMLLGKCEFGKEDYSLNIVNLPFEREEEEEPEIIEEELEQEEETTDENTDTQQKLF